MNYRRIPKMNSRLLSQVVALLAIVSLTLPASATWSIVMVNKRTNEVVIGSATCLTFFDLERGASIVVPGVGAGAAQSYVDTSGKNRLTIRLGLRTGKDPVDILQELKDQDPGHETRQYGIVDNQGRAVTFTGNQDGGWAGGLVGEIGDVVYAIQGNVLTGEPVVLEAERAVRDTPGNMLEKLMAGMEAARDMGGDGRCSCSPGDPERCGSPPDEFEKSAHIAYMIGSRIGDEIGPCDPGTGCAAGDYYLNFNYAFMSSNDPDPVDLLRAEYEAWKVDLAGVPDALESTVICDPVELPADGASEGTMTITLLDLNGDPIAVPMDSVTVESTPETKGIVRIGEVTDLGDGEYAVQIGAKRLEGVAEFVVTVNDGVRPVTLMPNPTLAITRPTTGLVLGDATPGVVGEINDFCISGGITGETVGIVWSRELGVRATACGQLLISSPMLVGKTTVDGDGNACVSRLVPNRGSGRTVYLQAIQFPSCERSNVVTWDIE